MYFLYNGDGDLFDTLPAKTISVGERDLLEVAVGEEAMACYQGEFFEAKVIDKGVFTTYYTTINHGNLIVCLNLPSRSGHCIMLLCLPFFKAGSHFPLV